MNVSNVKSPQYWQRLFIFLLVVVSVLSFMPKEPDVFDPDDPWYLRYLDKWEHGLAFTALGFSGFLAYRGKPLSVGMGLCLYGALIEILQPLLTASRFSDPLDFAADTSGVMLALVLSRSQKVLHRFRAIQSRFSARGA